MTGSPLTAVDLFALFGAWVAVVLAPGWAVTRLVAPQLGPLRTMALAPLATAGMAAAATSLLALLDQSIPRQAASLIGIAGLAAAVAVEIRRGQRTWVTLWTSVSSDRVRRLGLLSVGLATGAVLALWLIGVGDLQQPPNSDGTNHALFTASLLRAGTVDSQQVAVADLLTGGLPFGFYPLTFHALSGAVGVMSGTSVGAGLMATAILSSAVMWPVGVLLVTRALVPGMALAAPVSTVLAAALAAVPFGPMQWGGLPLLVSLSGMLGVVACLPAVRRRGEAVALGLAVAGMTAVHASQLFFLVPLLALTVLLPGTSLFAERRRLVTSGLLVLAVAGLVMSLWAVAASGGVEERTLIELNEDRPAWSAIATVLFFGSGMAPLPAAWVLLALVGALVGLRRGLPPGWVIAWALVGIAMVLLWSAETDPIRLLTVPWYSRTYRLGYYLTVLAAPVTGLALLAVIAAITSRIPAAWRLRTSVILVSLMALLVVVPGAVTVGRALDNVWHLWAVVDRDDLAAFRFLQEQNGPSARVLNDPRDSSAWMWVVGDVPPVNGVRTVTWLTDDWSTARTALVGAERAGEDPEVDAALAALGVRYLIAGGDQRYRETALGLREPGLDVAALLAGCAWRQVFQSGQVSVLEYAPCPAP